MIGKLLICYELELEHLLDSIAFLERHLKPQDIVCLKPDELFFDEEFFLYTFHLDLNDEINTHSLVSNWARKNGIRDFNPYYSQNIFDDKFLFANFTKVYGLAHPETILVHKNTETQYIDYIVKPRHGTEKKNFADFSKESLQKILVYDDALIQEKIDIELELKILYLDGDFYSSQVLSKPELDLLLDLDKKLSQYLQSIIQNKPVIYSIDLVKSIEGKYYFLELNLRPGALGARFRKLSRLTI